MTLAALAGAAADEMVNGAHGGRVLRERMWVAPGQSAGGGGVKFAGAILLPFVIINPGSGSGAGPFQDPVWGGGAGHWMLKQVQHDGGEGNGKKTGTGDAATFARMVRGLPCR